MIRGMVLYNRCCYETWTLHPFEIPETNYLPTIMNRLLTLLTWLIRLNVLEPTM